MSVRAAELRDAPAIERIARASFDGVYAFFAVRGTRHAWPLLVAEVDGSVTGFLEGKVFEGRPPIGYIYFVAVDPARRQHGAARELVTESLAAFARRGGTRVFAAVPRDNEASMALFTAFGFRDAPRRVLRQWYGWRGLKVQVQMLIAPHEVLLVREA